MTVPRDLPPGAGLLARAHRLAGEALLWLRAAFKAPTTLGVRLVAIDPEGRVMLVRHSYVPGWHLPGGAVDPGESALAAALREAREEAGLEVAAPPRLLGLYRHPAGGRRDHVAVYVARAAQAAPPPRSLEILAAGFFTPASLPEGTTAATRARIAEALGDAEPGSEW
ncbi:NUDIX domain-containing protein [Amaricoccus sp.]|uniref:NUDIX domain-containing protein n=1 Tax=Amaricoccus sp. TaxID=1872485 RepID=UPI001B6F035C|nr:NUDIX domain-containing protein [Amaricoccus sp.]MBP7243454.1 NUDIX domain-containing protein [Amaricoccus sp.]